MHPTPWPTRLTVHLVQRLPKPQRASANGQGWPVCQPVAFEVEQEFFPGLLALPVAIPEAYEFLLAAGVRANHDEETLACLLKSGLEGHAVNPARDGPFAREAAALPLRQFLVPALFQSAARRG